MTQRDRIYANVGYELAQAARERGKDTLALDDGDDQIFDRAYLSVVRRLSLKNAVVVPSEVKAVYGETEAEGATELHDVVKAVMTLDGRPVEYLTFNPSGEGETIPLSEVKAVKVNIDWTEYNLLIMGESEVPVEMANVYTKEFTVNGAQLKMFIVLNDTEYAAIDHNLTVPPELEDCVTFFIVGTLRAELRAEYMARYEKDKDEHRFTRHGKTVQRKYIPV